MPVPAKTLLHLVAEFVVAHYGLLSQTTFS